LISKFKFLKLLVPPILIDIISKYKKSKYGWFGDFPTWQDAENLCPGYNTEEVFNKVLSSSLKVKNGDWIYERDSVGYCEIQYSWPLLSCLLYIAIMNRGQLSIIDFGGSLGSSYFQNKKFISSLDDISWNIIEQPHFVKAGNQYFKSDELSFYTSIEECIHKNNPTAIVFSSSLQYISDPFELLEEVITHTSINYILFDLLGIIDDEYKSRITIQKVPPKIYNASYPCWFFNENELLHYLNRNDFHIVEKFNSYIGKNISIDNRNIAQYKGFLFQRKAI